MDLLAGDGEAAKEWMDGKQLDSMKLLFVAGRNLDNKAAVAVRADQHPVPSASGHILLVQSANFACQFRACLAVQFIRTSIVAYGDFLKQFLTAFGDFVVLQQFT